MGIIFSCCRLLLFIELSLDIMNIFDPDKQSASDTFDAHSVMCSLCVCFDHSLTFTRVFLMTTTTFKTKKTSSLHLSAIEVR